MREVIMSANEANRKRMLGIVGSPRRGGNTEILVDEVLRGAEEAGALVEKVILSELDIAPCRACDTCRKTGQCAQRDDMPALLEKMERSQAWVLGTPVYWWGPTAQFKAFLDRWYGSNYAMFKGRRIILTIPLEDTDASTARHTVGMFTDALAYLKAELFATVLAPGVLDRGQVREHPDVLEAARRAGRAAIEK
ncbi:MAG: flavodoxin family protein [Anaerolineales bacterium]|nr:MAG: flavodoxin family protein [Anaerolineales bacterium]